MRGRRSSAIFVDHLRSRALRLRLIQISAYDVRDHLDVEVLPERQAAPMPINLLYPHRRHLSQRLQAFVEWLTALFQARLQFAD